MARSEGVVKSVVVVAGCLIAVVFGPFLLNETVISTLTATPFRQAVSTFVASIAIGVAVLWVASPFIWNAAERASAKRTWGQGED